MTKIDLLAGKIEVENQPIAFQLLIIIFEAVLLVILACIFKEALILVIFQKQPILRAIRSLFRGP